MLVDEAVIELRADDPNRARDLIESFMVAANGVTARFLSGRGYPSIRRVVRSPERWTRIVDLAGRYGVALPPEPDSRALEQFLAAQRTARPGDFPDLSLSVIKLLGRGEYVADGAAAPTAAHFGARGDELHALDGAQPPLPRSGHPAAAQGGARRQERHRYDLDELTKLAAHCTRQEDAANKVERLVRKAAAALWMSNRIGDGFDALVTGASPKGTWVRLRQPSVEGRVERGEAGLDVGDRVRVRLLKYRSGSGVYRLRSSLSAGGASNVRGVMAAVPGIHAE